MKTLRLAVLCVRGNSENTTALKETTAHMPLIKVFPNPVLGNQIQFEMTDTEKDFTTQLIDIQGHVVASHIYKSNQYNNIVVLPIPNLITGIYYLKFIKEGSVSQNKIIVVRN